MDERIKPYKPYRLDNGAMVEMQGSGLFWACDIEDAKLIPEQGMKRTRFVLDHIILED